MIFHPASAAFLNADGTVEAGSDGRNPDTDTATDGLTAMPEVTPTTFTVSGASPFDYGVAEVCPTVLHENASVYSFVP